MSCCDNGFSSVRDFDSVDFITELHYGIKAYLDVGLLNIGAWQDVDTGDLSCGEDLYTFTKIPLPTVKNYQIWAAPKKEWVWEDITYDSGSPQEPTIYFSGVDSTNLCEINYKLGQIKTTSTPTAVTGSYSYKKVSISTEAEANWWRKLVDCIYGSNPNADLNSVGKLQLPAIVIETGDNRQVPLQLGSTATRVNQKIIFNIVTETVEMRNKLVTIMNGLHSKTFNVLNTNDGPKPLNCDGTKNSTYTYSDLPLWKCVRIQNMGSSNFDSAKHSLFFARIIIDFEIIHPFKPKNDV